jgi:drug/metabolite transporter (DMT)-like permease
MATVLFSYAVRLLGAAEFAAFGALTPILALLGGVLFLGEALTYLKIFGVILVAVGVFLASGITRKFSSQPKS